MIRLPQYIFSEKYIFLKSDVKHVTSALFHIETISDGKTISASSCCIVIPVINDQPTSFFVFKDIILIHRNLIHPDEIALL